MSKHPKKPRRRAQIPARPSPLGPNAAAPTPRDLPRIRARMLEWAEDRSRFGATEWLEKISAAIAAAKTDAQRSEPFGTDTAASWARVLRTGELFYVAEALSALTRHAAETLSGYDLHPEDVPAETGVMFYADPLRDSGAPDPEGAPINLITWGPMGNSIVIHFWSPTSYRDTTPGRPLGFLIPGFAKALHENRHRLPKQIIPPHPLPLHGFLYQRAVAIPFGGPIDVDYVTERKAREHECTGEDCQTCLYADLARDTARLQKLIVATWLLMGQPITLTTPITPKPLGTGKRNQRPEPLKDTVRYVELRAIKRPPAEQPDEHNAPGRVYQHSWVVRGHWRRQWYPSRGEHRPLWIAPHLAGPEDAPLIGGDRVNVLRR